MITREQRRKLHRDNLKFGAALSAIPESEWPATPWGYQRQMEVWRSRDYLVQAFHERDGIVRLTVCRTEVGSDGEWLQEIPWEDMQRLKAETGRGDMFAVEIFPRDCDVVNVANMRHLWVLPKPLNFGWRLTDVLRPGR